MATARTTNDPDLQRRVRRHRDRRPEGWETQELGGGPLNAVLEEAERRDAVLLDSLTLWVSARMEHAGDEEVLGDLGRFLEEASAFSVPLILVSDEVGLGVVPESPAGRRFRDLLGLANQKAAAAAEEVRLYVAGLRIKVK